MRTGILKRTLVAVAIIVLSVSVSAQGGDKAERRAQLESKKVAYCTDRAGLTADESAQYWAVRNEIDEQKKALKDEVPRRKDIDPETATDKEIRDAIKKRLEQHIKAEQLEYDNLDKLMNIVGVKKYALLQKAEKEFKREILKSLSEGRGQRESRGNRPDRLFED